MDMEKLVEMSRRYGRDDRYVLAGGGNTSCKENGVMAVKASGAHLADIDSGGFVLMDVDALKQLPTRDYPEGDDQREAAAVRDMMAARLPDQREKRPSVECILHALFPQPYVLHVHPALVNGMTCGRDGAKAAATLFPEAVWIPLTKPGLILSQVCAEAFSAGEKMTGKPVDCVFLQNHGIFLAGDSVAEIDEKMGRIMETLSKQITRFPSSAPADEKSGGAGRRAIPDAASDADRRAIPDAASDADRRAIPDAASDADRRAIPDASVNKGAIPAEVLARISALDPEGGSAFTLQNGDEDILAFSESDGSMAPLLKPFTPDHIVYSRPAPLYVKNPVAMQADYDAFLQTWGFKPRILVLQNAGAVAMGASEKEAASAMALFQDAARVAVYSLSFGGPLQLPDDFTRFITNWEIESYRAKQSLGG